MKEDFLVGEWLVQPSLGRISKEGRVVAVRAKVMDLLVFLAARPGQVVSKDKLLDGVWSVDAVSESLLTRTMTELRQAFGDDVDQPLVIENIPKRGYRLIAPVSALPDPNARGAATEPPAPRIARRRLARRSALVMAAVAIAAVVAFALKGRESDALPERQFERLTTAGGMESFPSLSPDGQFVVYAAQGAEGLPDIFLQAVGGQQPINLTQHASTDTHPAFSPDGRLIAFSSDRDGGGIFVMHRDGGALKRITAGGHFHPAWAPDGQNLVFGTGSVGPLRPDPDARNSVSELWEVDVASERQHRISAGDCVQPAISPDGTRIACWAFPVSNESPPQRTSGEADLITLSRAGGDLHRLTSDAATDWNPLWSADGRFIFFASERAGAMGLWRIRVVDGRAAAEPDPIGVPAAWFGALTRSADGRTVAFASFNETQNIYRVAFDADAEALMGSAISITTDSLSWNQPEISPDGLRLAVWSSRRQEDLYVMGADGSGRRPLMSDLHRDRRPAWSPDGQTIAFFSSRTGGWSIWSIRPDGSGLREVARMPGRILIGPRWSPDGSRIMVTDLDRQQNHLFAVGSEPAVGPLETLPRFPGEGGYAAWSYSPEGNLLAGMSYSAGGRPLPGLQEGWIWLYSFSAKSYERITEGAQPIWLKDGRRLLYVLGGRIMLVDTLSRRTRELLGRGQGDLQDIALSNDNRHIYLTRRTSEADIWLMTFK